MARDSSQWHGNDLAHVGKKTQTAAPRTGPWVVRAHASSAPRCYPEGALPKKWCLLVPVNHPRCESDPRKIYIYLDLCLELGLETAVSLQGARFMKVPLYVTSVMGPSQTIEEGYELLPEELVLSGSDVGVDVLRSKSGFSLMRVLRHNMIWEWENDSGSVLVILENIGQILYAIEWMFIIYRRLSCIKIRLASHEILIKSDNERVIMCHSYRSKYYGYSKLNRDIIRGF